MRKTARVRAIMTFVYNTIGHCYTCTDTEIMIIAGSYTNDHITFFQFTTNYLM